MQPSTTLSESTSAKPSSSPTPNAFAENVFAAVAAKSGMSFSCEEQLTFIKTDNTVKLSFRSHDCSIETFQEEAKVKTVSQLHVVSVGSSLLWLVNGEVVMNKEFHGFQNTQDLSLSLGSHSEQIGVGNVLLYDRILPLQELSLLKSMLQTQSHSTQFSTTKPIVASTSAVTPTWTSYPSLPLNAGELAAVLVDGSIFVFAEEVIVRFVNTCFLEINTLCR